MAQFNYEQYAAQQAARKTTSNTQTSDSSRTEIHFFGEFMKNDGDVAVVRFPYRALSDVVFETTHLVDYPGRKFKARVSCGGNGCSICQQGIKIDTRCFVKGLIYVADDSGKMSRYNAIWDRPSAFADIELKNLINEYGDLTSVLFKIRRTGSGLSTRYTTSIVLPNNSIYNDATCPADFSELDKIDPSKVLCKSINQYNAALNPETAANADNVQPTAPEQQPVAAPAPMAQPAPAYTPAPEINSNQYAANIPATPTIETSTASESGNAGRQQRRYVF